MKALPAELQLEYPWKVDSESSGATWSQQTIEKSEAQPEAEQPQETIEALNARIKAEAKRSITRFADQELEFKRRLQKLANNE